MKANEIETAIANKALSGGTCTSKEEYEEVDRAYYKAIRELRILCKLANVLRLIK